MAEYNLEKILPHNPPMILIDELLDIDLDNNIVKASVTITEDKIFYHKNLGGISPLAGIEFMAQTVGCYAYFRNGGIEPKIGFLLGSRLYKNYIEKFEEGKTYTINVSMAFSDSELVSFDCFIYNDDMECARATVNVYQPADITNMEL